MPRKKFIKPIYVDTQNKIDLSNIQRIREKKGFTQVKLSMMVGISQQSITFYETNTRYPSLPTLIRIAEALDTSVDSLIGINSKIEKYYDLSKQDKETVDRMIESLSNKTTN